MIKYLLIASAGLSGLILLNGCAFLVHGIKRSKNLAYVAPAAAVFDSLSHRLDIYAPAGKGKARPVLIFVHGGNWGVGR
jgi:acetyl esterase/lipase